jgi:hypothetical protein
MALCIAENENVNVKWRKWNICASVENENISSRKNES